VEEARRAFRRHRRNSIELAWQESLEANKAKGAAIRQVKKSLLKKKLIMCARKEEKASEGWQTGLSQKLSFFPHHLQFLPSLPPRALPPRLKPSATP
jgi:hypothetical protein